MTRCASSIASHFEPGYFVLYCVQVSSISGSDSSSGSEDESDEDQDVGPSNALGRRQRRLKDGAQAHQMPQCIFQSPGELVHEKCSHNLLSYPVNEIMFMLVCPELLQEYDRMHAWEALRVMA